MKVHQTLEWLNLLSLGTKGLKPYQQSGYNQGSVTGGGWRWQHLNSQQHSLTTLIRHFVLWNKRALSSADSCIVYTDLLISVSQPQCCQVLTSIHGHIRQKLRPFSKISRPPIKKFVLHDISKHNNQKKIMFGEGLSHFFNIYSPFLD